ncbi:MAG: acyltransferase family protein [Prevotella sp.]|nr:acyltransferase family protein [Prevotella sp.]
MEFSKEGQDLSLDFVKGICILLVVMNHSIDEAACRTTLFWLWGFPAVPLFLLIQVFHSYKKGYGTIRLNLMKILKRAVLPFLIVEILIFVCYFAMNPGISVHTKLMGSLYWGGRGPGSYYPLIYIQFAILLPLFKPMFRRFSVTWLGILFLLLSVGAELLCSLIDIPHWLYRLLFLRYIFLIYLGYLLVEKGIVMNAITLILSVVSLVAAYCFEIRGVDWSPWFFHTEDWRTFHWICYFYMAFLIFYFLCKFFYWLSVNSLIENVVCRLGTHSYAIYIFQLFYFSTIAPSISDLLLYVGNPIVKTFLYIVISVVLCSVPVIRFVKGVGNKMILGRVVLLTLSTAGVLTTAIWLMRPFYMPPYPFKPYEVTQHNDDTLRVVMIGDSWVYFHETLRRDSTFEAELKRVLKSHKVKVIAKGKGGAVSGEIYERMSAERMLATEFDLNNCSQPILEQGADYCVISAGINDARQRRGKHYYVTNYFHIIRLLLSMGIRPVVMEIPDVEVDEAFAGNTLFYRLRSRLAMSVLKTDLYGTHDYRQALKDSLIAHQLVDSIIYVSYDKWNPEGWRDKREIYTDDHFHLNLLGYAILDSTFAAEIVKDYRLRKKR